MNDIKFPKRKVGEVYFWSPNKNTNKLKIFAGIKRILSNLSFINANL